MEKYGFQSRLNLLVFSKEKMSLYVRKRPIFYVLNRAHILKTEKNCENISANACWCLNDSLKVCTTSDPTQEVNFFLCVWVLLCAPTRYS